MTPDASPLLPGLPTMKELGAEPGLPSYFGAFAPGKTPAAIVDTLASEIAKTLEQPKVKEFLAAQTLIPVGNSPRICGLRGQGSGPYRRGVLGDGTEAQRVALGELDRRWH